MLWNLSSWYVNYNIVKGRTAFEDKAYDSAIRHYNYALLGIKYTKFFSIIPFFSLIEKEKITEYQGTSYYQIKKYDKAISMFNESLNYSPNRFRPYVYIAESYYEKGDIAQAIKYHKMLVELSVEKKDFFYFYKLGYSLSHLQEHEQAIPAFQSALEIRPERKDIHLYIAGCYSVLNKKRKALEHLKKAVAYKKEFLKFTKTSPMFNNIKNSDEFKSFLESQMN